MSSISTCRWPIWHVRIDGVLPPLNVAFISIVPNKNAAQSTLPSWQAMWIGAHASSFCLLRSAPCWARTARNYTCPCSTAAYAGIHAERGASHNSHVLLEPQHMLSRPTSHLPFRYNWYLPCNLRGEFAALRFDVPHCSTTLFGIRCIVSSHWAADSDRSGERPLWEGVTGLAGNPCIFQLVDCIRMGNGRATSGVKGRRNIGDGGS